MDADGSNQTNLSNNAAPDDLPDCSPDGTKVVFDSFRVASVDIYVMDIDGSDQIRLTDDPADESFPSWSPDGTKIAFERGGDIWVMGADGSSQDLLTTHPSFDTAPAWSPDGTKIAFHSSRDGNKEIYVMDADGSDETRVTYNTSSDSYPDWQPLVSSTPTPGPVGGVAELTHPGSSAVRGRDGDGLSRWLPASAFGAAAMAAAIGGWRWRKRLSRGPESRA